MKKFLLFPWIIAAVLPLVFFGFRYFPILDDYIQYGCYPLYSDVSYVFTTIGTLSTRPVAGLLDPIFWGRFYHCPGVAVCLITTLHLCSAYFFYRITELYGFSLSPLFYIIYLFLPLGMEGRFWLSASTRIVVGMFFTSLSLWLLTFFLQLEFSYFRFAFFALMQLISFSFYESVTIFSLISVVLLASFSLLKNDKKKCIFVLITTFLNLVLLLFYYFYFRKLGLSESRINGFSVTGLLPNISQVLQQIFEIFSATSVFESSFLGLKILFSKKFKGVLFLLLIGLLSTCFSLSFTTKKAFSKREILSLFLCGLFLFFLPFLPYAMTDMVWLTNRSIFASIPGFALILQGFFALFHKKHIQKLAIFILSFMFLTANIFEYNTYLTAGKLDNYILNEIVCQLDNDVLLGRKNLQVVLPERMLLPQCSYYKDHVASVFDSEWALTGALRAVTKNLSIKSVKPVFKGEKTNPDAQIIELYPLKTYLDKLTRKKMLQ